MTEHNNSNAYGERPNPTPNNGDPGSADFDAAWAQFAAEHAEDLNDVERSRNAKRFEKHAQRKEKEALLSVDDLDPDAFTGSSWLDTDDVMDRYGDPFTPPNPDLGPVNKSKLVFWILLVVGVIGVIGSVFLPSMAAVLGTVFGTCALIGAAGLIVRHKGHNETKTDYFDDGARV